jgi:hypothetical protein
MTERCARMFMRSSKYLLRTPRAVVVENLDQLDAMPSHSRLSHRKRFEFVLEYI